MNQTRLDNLRELRTELSIRLAELESSLVLAKHVGGVASAVEALDEAIVRLEYAVHSIELLLREAP